jgi:hypothetical protein
LYIQVVEKWLGKEACSSQEFDGIDLTNRLGSDKVLFKVTWDFLKQCRRAARLLHVKWSFLL